MAVPWWLAVTGYTGVGVASHLVCCLRKAVEGRTDRTAAAGNRKAMMMPLAALTIMWNKNYKMISMLLKFGTANW